MNRRSMLGQGLGTLAALGTSSILAPSLKANPIASTGITADDPIRLCCNENPYGPSPMARQAIIDHLMEGNRYQHPLRDQLAATIGEQNGLGADQVFIGAGSSEIIRLVGMLAALEGKHILTADLTFTWMQRYAKLFGAKSETVAIDAQKRFDLDKIKKALHDKIGLVYICNPNNPSATAVDSRALIAFCQEVAPKCPILVDEAYIEYTEGGLKNSMAKLIAEFPQIIISRTFSKLYGLAGMRIGYALASPEYIARLKEFDPCIGMAVSSGSLRAAQASLNDLSFIEDSLAKNKTTRDFMYKKFAEWGFKSYDSATNFIMVDTRHLAFDFAEKMKDKKVTMAALQNEHKGLNRITVGTMPEMQAFAKRVESIL